MPPNTKQMIRAFFASPFAEEYRWIRDAASTACREMDVEFRAVDETVLPGDPIVDAIHAEIATSDIGIAVITGFNRNVMYELGRLLGQSKPTILLADAESIGHLPFDLRGFSIIRYDSVAKNRADLTNVIAKSLARLKTAQEPSFLQTIATSGPIPASLSTLTISLTASEVQALPKIDWGAIQTEAERMLKKKGCKPIDIEVIDTDDMKGWRQTLDCPCGDTIVVVVDMNGDIKRAKIR